jgi:hypothetical protein
VTRYVLDIDDSQWKADHLPRVLRTTESEWLEELACQVEIQIADARPLIVLDLGSPEFAAEIAPQIVACLRREGWGKTADQIEAQTKPARIPEPGWDGKVTASTDGNPTRRDFIRFSTDGGRSWDWCDGSRAASAWKYLIDPTLIREGVTE